MEFDLDALFSWGRYLHWADLAWQSYNSSRQDVSDASDPVADSKMIAQLARWLASLYVVLEGWKRLNLHDPIIDFLIDDYADYCDALRRFRNAVFHYQKCLYDQRMLDFMKPGWESLLWASALHIEFKRYLWGWPDTLIGTTEQKDELRASVREIVGWLPTDIPQAWAAELEKLVQEAESMLEADGDRLSPAGEELREAIRSTKGHISSIGVSPLIEELIRSRGRRT